MNIEEHLLYQDLFFAGISLDDMLSTFKRIAEQEQSLDLQDFYDRSLPTSKDNKLSNVHPEKAQKNAVLIRYIMKRYSYDDFFDLINLAIKEKLARDILILQNTKETEIKAIEDALNSFCERPVGKRQINPTMALGIRVNLISQFISENLHYIGVAKNYVLMRDINAILNRVIGEHGTSGRIGGKSAGMILANRVLVPSLAPEDKFDDIIDEIDSYYIKSQVFARFIEHNKLEECYNIKYLEHEEIEKLQSGLFQKIISGEFQPSVKEQIIDFLSSVPEEPLIVRSSSLLEDNIGSPFCGKYDSYFTSNRGSLEERYIEVTSAIKKVYFSIYKLSALQYRKDKNLLDFNENMCVLIQKVVGNRYGRYFFPQVSGVAFSRNYYRWSGKIKMEDGMARMVLGLGTRAVDRVGDDYPRIVSFTDPSLRPETGIKEMMKYSQKMVDVLNIETKEIETINFVDLYNALPEKSGKEKVFRDFVSVLKDGEIEPTFLFPPRLEYGQCALTFEDSIKKNHLFTSLKNILKKLEESYATPVDVEFSFNNGKLYILQCRPLYQNEKFAEEVTIPDYREENVVFSSNRVVSGNSVIKGIRYLVYVDVDAYAALPSNYEKLDIARLIGSINRILSTERFILLGPGRWGSSNIDLGVKVGYNEINNSKLLVEIAKNRHGYTPEASFGTHFFQDLIEADIFPLPVYPEQQGNYLNEDFFRSGLNALGRVMQNSPNKALSEKYSGVVTVIDLEEKLSGAQLTVYLDADHSIGTAIIDGV